MPLVEPLADDPQDGDNAYDRPRHAGLPVIRQTLDRYRIESKLGEGGMSVVYKARDTHLDRVVAIKVLPGDRVSDPERKQCFVQEAKAASALNHPNIVTVHDIRSDSGVDFIVMEFAEGRTLDQIIPAKGLGIAQALRIGAQIADALATAHEAGIVHRDLKPSNVSVTDSGPGESPGFRARQARRSCGSRGRKPDAHLTIDSDGNGCGHCRVYVARAGRGPKGGRPVRHLQLRRRSLRDGHRPQGVCRGFEFVGAGEDPQRGPCATEHADRVGLIRRGASHQRCLRKDPARRYQTMADLKVALDDLAADSAAGQVAQTPAVRRSRPWPWAAAALIALVAGGYFGWRALRTPAPAAVPLHAVPLTALPGIVRSPSFSPDGNHVAFTWTGPKQDNTDVYVQQIGAGESMTTGASGPLWRLPLHGGAPGKLVEGVNATGFEVIDKGVYYLERAAGETKLRYFDFATRQSTLVAGNLGTVTFGLTASRDGRTILYSRIDSSVND